MIKDIYLKWNDGIVKEFKAFDLIQLRHGISERAVLRAGRNQINTQVFDIFEYESRE